MKPEYDSSLVLQNKMLVFVVGNELRHEAVIFALKENFISAYCNRFNFISFNSPKEIISAEKQPSVEKGFLNTKWINDLYFRVP